MIPFIKQKTVLAFVRAQGLTANYSREWMEYRIDYRKSDARWNEDSSYLTTYPDDAVSTAVLMANFKG